MAASSVKSDKTVEWVKTVLLSHQVLSPAGQENIQCDVKPLDTTGDGYMSVLYVANITSAMGTNSLIVKLFPTPGTAGEQFCSRNYFYNEARFLGKTFKLMVDTLKSDDRKLQDALASVSEEIPRCYYSCVETTKEMIAMENLKVKGFELCEKTMDIHHVRLSVEALARFHGISYAMKMKHAKIFQEEVIDPIKETHFAEESAEVYKQLVDVTAPVPIDLFREYYPEEYDKHLEVVKRLRAQLEHGGDLMERLTKSEDPLAVLCHGDFNRNNLMFRYEDGSPREVRVIDFQTVSYSSPAVDLTTLLFMNCTPEMRAKHWDDVIATYVNTLRDFLAAVVPGYSLDVFTADAVREEVRRYGLLGYFPTAFFLPVVLASPEMLAEIDENFANGPLSKEQTKINHYYYLAKGDEEVKRRLAALVKEIIELGIA